MCIRDREKVGSVGQHQIGLPYLPEHRRQIKKQKRQEDELRRISEYKQKRKEVLTLQPNEVLFSDEDEEPTDVTDEESEDPLQNPCDDFDVPSTSSISQYNTLQLSYVVLQSIR